MGAHRDGLVWSAQAEADLISIWQWGAEEWSDRVADEHLFNIERTCERLINNLMLGKARDELIVGVRSLPVRPHVVFYRVGKRHVQIVRVLNQRMDVEHIFAR